MIISTDEEKALTKHSFMIKAPKGKEGLYLKIIKVEYDKTTTNMVLVGKN
jgi:hypothetical protein